MPIEEEEEFSKGDRTLVDYQEDERPKGTRKILSGQRKGQKEYVALIESVKSFRLWRGFVNTLNGVAWVL